MRESVRFPFTCHPHTSNNPWTTWLTRFKKHIPTSSGFSAQFSSSFRNVLHEQKRLTKEQAYFMNPAKGNQWVNTQKENTGSENRAPELFLSELSLPLTIKSCITEHQKLAQLLKGKFTQITIWFFYKTQKSKKGVIQWIVRFGKSKTQFHVTVWVILKHYDAYDYIFWSWESPVTRKRTALIF